MARASMPAIGRNETVGTEDYAPARPRAMYGKRRGAARATSQRCSKVLAVTALPARRSVAYLVLLVVYQICGAPFTPDFSIAAFNSAEAANALAFSRL